MLELFTDTAFISRDSGTMSEMIAWRLGMLNAIIDPLMRPMAITCQKTIRPVASSVASRNVITAFPLWLKITRCRRGMRSAITPPNRDTTVIGAVTDTIDRLRARGESFISSTTSQDWVTICMFMAMKEANEPRKTHRKSRYARVLAMGRPRRRESGLKPERAGTIPASMSGDVSSVSPILKGE